jgi:hypothetical protein
VCNIPGSTFYHPKQSLEGCCPFINTTLHSHIHHQQRKMFTPTKHLVKLNCVTIGDSEVHHIQVPAHSTFVYLKKQLVAAFFFFFFYYVGRLIGI